MVNVLRKLRRELKLTEVEWISNMRKSLLCKSIYLRARVVVLLTKRNDVVNILVTNQPIEIVKTT